MENSQPLFKVNICLSPLFFWNLIIIIFLCLKKSHSSWRLSLLFFILFSSFSNLFISKLLPFRSLICFPFNLLCCRCSLFPFMFHPLNTSGPEFLSGNFFIISMCFQILILFIRFSLISSNCLSELSCRSLNFLQTAMLNSLSARSQNSVFELSHWKIIVIFWCRHVFLNLPLPCSFALLLPHLKEQIPPQIFTSYLQLGYSVHCFCYTWNFLWPCMDTSAPHFCFPVWQNSQALASSLILTTQQVGCRKPLFCFPEDGTIFQVCGNFLSYWFSPGFLKALGLQGSHHCTPEYVQRAACRVGGGMDLACRGFGGTCGPGEAIFGWGSPPRLLGKLPADVLIAVSTNCIPLILYITLSISFPIVSPLQVVQVLPQYSGCWWKAMGFSSCFLDSWGGQAYTYPSLVSCRRAHLQTVQPHSVSSWVGAGNILFTLSTAFNSYFFPPFNVLLESPLRKVGLCGSLPKVDSPQSMAERSRGRLAGSIGPAAWTGVCLSITGRTGGDSSQVP